MKKILSIITIALFSCVMIAQGQTNYLTKLQLPQQYQLKVDNKPGKQNNLYALVNPDRKQEIQNLNMITRKSKSGIGGLTIGGIIVAALGIGLLAGGIAMVVDSDGQTSYTNENGQETGSLEGGLGAVMAAGGAVLTVGGTAMIIIGIVHNKHKSGRRH